MAGFGYALSAACKLGLPASTTAGPTGAILLLDRTGKGIRTAPRDALVSMSTPPARLAEAFGTLADALEAGPARILRTAEEIGLKLRGEAVDFLARKPDLEELGTWALGVAKAAGARVVVIGDAWYPPLLREIENPPPLLYVRGGLTPDVPRARARGMSRA